MKSCPNCRTKFDPTFTMFCPECGTSIDPNVGSMSVPTPEPLRSESEARHAAEIQPQPASAGPAAEALQRSAGPGFGGRLVRGMGLRLAIAVVFVAIGGVVGLFEDDGPDVSTDITFEPIEAGDFSLGEDVNASALVIGDCVNWPSDDGEIFESLERLDCAIPHDAEVFALVSHPAEAGAEYPGNDTVADWGVQACYEQFEPYVGRSYEDAQELEYTFFTPTELGWRKYDDRVLQCLVFNVDETTLMSSVKTGA